MTSDEIFANLAAAYAERLEKRAQEWQVKHPDEAKQIREEVTARFRRAMKPDPEPGSIQWLMVEAAVVDAIRAKKGWPTLREYERIQAGEEPIAKPINRPKPQPVKPIRDYDDRKSKAAGE